MIIHIPNPVPDREQAEELKWFFFFPFPHPHVIRCLCLELQAIITSSMLTHGEFTYSQDGRRAIRML